MIHAASQPFLPATLGGYASIAGALAAAVAALLSAYNRRHLQEVHVLVNGRLSRVESELEQTAAERDRLRAEKGQRRRTDKGRLSAAPDPDPEPEDPTS
jgi:hypothetical protein